MKLEIPRELFLSRIAARIEFLEAEKRKVEEREAKIREIENVGGSRQMIFSATSRFDSTIAFLRFAVEHLPNSNVIELQAADVLILGIHSPKDDGGPTGCF